MRLTNQQQLAVREKFGICINSVCDRCVKPLDCIRYTRKDQVGEFCSRLCRDGQEAEKRYLETRKAYVRNTPQPACGFCQLRLPTAARVGTLFCDSTCQRNARLARSLVSRSQTGLGTVLASHVG
jgi:hypothetical protein